MSKDDDNDENIVKQELLDLVDEVLNKEKAKTKAQPKQPKQVEPKIKQRAITISESTIIRVQSKEGKVYANIQINVDWD